MKASTAACVMCAVISVGTGVASAQTVGPDGWTILSPPSGARVVYASRSRGSDANDGASERTPVQTIARGYELLRDGHADQLLLRCGDVWKTPIEDWQKSAASTTAYMVIGSYGMGPRPRIDSGESSGFSSLTGAPRRGLAIVGLEFASNGFGVSESAGIELVENWGHVLIEDCFVSKYRDNIAVVPLESKNRARDIKIRRSIIVDSYHTGQAHSQGIFLGNCDDWLIEECVLDRNGANRGTIFCHNVYVHQACGPGVFRGNISARACSHGVQQRPGGIAENNLLLRNSVGMFVGRSQYAPTENNVVRYNVVLDAKDINPHEPRAQGLEISDVMRAEIELNIVAHQKTGTGNMDAISISRAQNVNVRDNVVYHWALSGEETSVALLWAGSCSGDCEVIGNRFVQSQGGMLVAHALDSPYLPSFRYRLNKYYSINPINAYLWFANDSLFLTNSEWTLLAGDSGSFFAPVQFPEAERTIELYSKIVGAGGSLEEFLAQARRQSKQFWRPQFGAPAANKWFRQGFAVYCPADFDHDGVLATADFAAFHVAFQAGSPNADMNRDGLLNILDYTVFTSAAAEGCP